MASTPAWIGTPRGGQWSLTLQNQVTARNATPASDSLVFTAGSGGAHCHDIVARPLGTNVASVLHVWIYNPINQRYAFVGSQALGASTAPATGADFSTPSNGQVRCSNILPVTLFPASNTTTANTSLPIGPSCLVYAALDTAVAAGWVINFFGGDC